MDDLIKVSVIIPVYNGEQYLERCLNSLADQTIDELEIIIVDNGSSDGSIALIESFIQNWSTKRRIIFLTESVSGNAYARNKGIAQARGEYITFVDQDDFVDRQLFEQMYNSARDLGSDVIASGYRIVDSEGNLIRSIKLNHESWAPYRVVAPWAKLYKRSLIEDNSLGFLTVNKGEDVFFVLNAYNCAKRIDISLLAGYQWVYNKMSLSHTEHKQIDKKNSIISLFNELQSSLYPLKTVEYDLLEYLLIKLIVHEIMFCAKGETYQSVCGYYDELVDWIDANYPENESNRYLGAFSPKGEEIKRCIFVAFFWKMKRYKAAKRFIYLYKKIFK